MIDGGIEGQLESGLVEGHWCWGSKMTTSMVSEVQTKRRVTAWETV
jgi:hypothetical protein